ncbi:UPF0187-domain-containing protein [Phlegmacium glaucopus]|nr:UPF0187-domain-containing protein [Phlegmacium glaucopus]
MNAMKSVLPTIRASKIKRKHLRKYTWLPDVFRIQGSIIGRIAGPVLTVTLFSVLVVYASLHGYKLVLTNSIVPLLSVVVGLILVFRNGTSYDRYWEGRKAFATMSAHTRNMARAIWINASLPPTDTQPSYAKGKTPTSEVTAKQLKRRKIDALRLCLSFVFATKHYLRGEDGVNWPDYQDVLPASFTRLDEAGNSSHKAYAAIGNESTSASRDASSNASSIILPESKPDATKRIRVKRSKQHIHISDQSTPLLADTHHQTSEGSLPLPMVIAHELNRIVYGFRRDGFLETIGPAGLNGLNQTISGLVDQLTAMERIANTPIPKSYSVHLKQCVTLYLFALPTVLVNDFGWGTVPVVTAIAFTFMGIEGIADEIEMPFGNDEHDLPLERYCEDLKEEIDYMIDRLPEGGEGLHGYDDGEGDD